ncbi:SDR family NAD(P)-dependent oxidoreductase [Herpetosiphon giganteus]|uniref:SDR family NAD(P)-dependent oxidoreductase n=1 Tax=Herpetosiphon giganteus TaxID=2029754 RepID=UPI0019569947|nr:SDR family NAD(P)-dependent oxidoreductase [Herpetosiphon giganteus]MBM7845341.1 NAD(P)-dependent dehydrogenase (short-subunit alcohol dehydrogenase family) [Herpetosiphon giganteus]
MATQSLPKTALITGANSGIGLELTKRLLNEGWAVVGLMRSQFPTNEPILQAAQTTGKLRSYQAELSDFGQLRTALQTIKQHETSIDLLFNNAGGTTERLLFSPQGRELSFELQSVVPYIIAMELKALLLRGQHKTIINTSSNALLTIKQFQLDQLEKPQSFKKLFGPYASSKLALSLWSQALAPQLAQEGITVLSVCPGANRGSLKTNAGLPWWLRPIHGLLFKHPSTGAEQLYRAAFNQQAFASGSFINKGRNTTLPAAQQAQAVLAKVHTIYQQAFVS